MKNDIFNSCCGNASGDIFNEAVGYSPTYDDKRMQYLRDRVSIALNAKALAESEQKQAELDYHNCQKKGKLRCNLRTRGDRLDEKDSVLYTANQAYNAALADVKQAEKANAEAKDLYEKSVLQSNIEADRQADILKSQPQVIETSDTNSIKSGISAVTGNKNLIYIGLSVLALIGGFFIYKKVK